MFPLSQMVPIDIEVTHLSWLWSMCCGSLVRGSNYQRRETVIKLSTLIVRMMNEVLESSHRVGKARPYSTKVRVLGIQAISILHRVNNSFVR